MFTRLRQPLVIFGLVHAILFLLVFSLLSDNYGAGLLERFFALKILDGQVPYIDFATEYPPLALLSFLLPALVWRTPLAYTRVFAVEMLVLDLLALALIAVLANRLKLPVSKTLTMYTLFVAAMGPIMVSRYDLLPAVLVLAALYTCITGKNKSAWALLALGFAAKLYPIIIAPFFALYCLRRRQYARLIAGSATFLGVTLILILPWLVLDARSLLSFLSYHAERGLHSESTYGSILLVGQLLNLTRVQAGLTFGSWNLMSPLTDKLATVSIYITAALLLIIYAGYGRWLWRQPNRVVEVGALGNESAWILLGYSSLAILAFLLANKVFSPQYLIWLCPLLPLVIAERHYWLWVLFALSGVVTQFIYPYHYIEFEMGQPYVVVLLFGRNLLLIILTVLTIFLLGIVPAPGKLAEAKQ